MGLIMHGGVAYVGIANISDANDVDLSSPANGQFLKYDGEKWVNAPISAVYHAAGSKTCEQLISSLLIAENEGCVYNISNEGETTADFVEGAGHPIHVGDNVGIANVGTVSNPVYKFDLLSGIVDLSDYYDADTVDELLAEKANADDLGDLASVDLDGAGSTKFLRGDGTWQKQTAQAQSDWNQTDSSASDYIKNKPTLGTAAAKDIPSSGNASTAQVVMGNDTRLSDARNAADVYSWAKAESKPSYTASEVGAIAATTKGANNGVAELDSTGKVPSSQLPSFVDDVLEYDSMSTFPTTGETGKIYVAKDTNKTYRWSGTAYVEISPSLALGETSSTAYRGDRGKTAYDHSQTTSGNPHNVTKSDVGLGNVPNVTTDNQTPTVTEASTRANLASGDTLKTIIGKIKKFFSDLKTVAFTGSYNDLTDKPTIPSGQIQSDWTQTNTSAVDYIKNKPTSMPASDVYSWAKESTKPSYTASEVGATPFNGNLTTLGSGTPAAETKTYWENNSNIPVNSVSTAYNTSGVEYTLLFSKGESASYGSVLKYGYTDKYLYLLRRNGGSWLDSDWAKISAGYADSAESATTSTYSYYPKIVATNEIRFDVNTKLPTVGPLYIGYAWSDGTRDAKISRYIFENGNENLTEVQASTFIGDLTGNAATATYATSAGSATDSTKIPLAGTTALSGSIVPNITNAALGSTTYPFADITSNMLYLGKMGSQTGTLYLLNGNTSTYYTKLDASLPTGMRELHLPDENGTLATRDYVNNLFVWETVDDITYGSIMIPGQTNVKHEINLGMGLGHIYGRFTTSAALQAYQREPLIYVGSYFDGIQGGTTVFNDNQKKAHDVLINGGVIQWGDVTTVGGACRFYIDYLYKLP